MSANEKVIDINRRTQPTDDKEMEKQVAPPAVVTDDDAIALRLAEELKDVTAYFHNEWKIYEHGVWTRRDTSEVRRYIRKQLRGWRQYGVKVSQNKIKSLTSMLEDDLFVGDRAIMALQDEQRKYVNMRNGLFNLTTMELEAHRPELRFTSQLDFDYDPDAKCPNFRRYLETSLVHPDSEQHDESLALLLIEALGYSMTARTDLKASFWLVGAKDSGKSTFVALLKAIMGSLHATIDLTQLGTNRFLLSGIVGKRVITFTEASGSTVLPDYLYKALVGGSDEIQADVKNRDPITFRPESKVWWAMNDMPRMVDRSGATARRIFMIPFNRTVPEAKRIGNLETRLAGERSGIFNLMVTHYCRLLENGNFDRCEQSEAMRDDYILSNDTEATFLNEELERGDDYTVQARDLYDRYKWWCDRFGHHPKAINQVKQEWVRLGLKVRKSSSNFYQGARLKQPAIVQ